MAPWFFGLFIPPPLRVFEEYHSVTRAVQRCVVRRCQFLATVLMGALPRSFPQASSVQGAPTPTYRWRREGKLFPTRFLGEKMVWSSKGGKWAPFAIDRRGGELQLSTLQFYSSRGLAHRSVLPKAVANRNPCRQDHRCLMGSGYCLRYRCR